MLVAANAYSRLNIQHIFTCAIFSGCSNNLIATTSTTEWIAKVLLLYFCPQEVKPQIQVF